MNCSNLVFFGERLNMLLGYPLFFWTCDLSTEKKSNCFSKRETLSQPKSLGYCILFVDQKRKGWVPLWICTTNRRWGPIGNRAPTASAARRRARRVLHLAPAQWRGFPPWTTGWDPERARWRGLEAATCPAVGRQWMWRQILRRCRSWRRRRSSSGSRRVRCEESGDGAGDGGVRVRMRSPVGGARARESGGWRGGEEE